MPLTRSSMDGARPPGAACAPPRPATCPELAEGPPAVGCCRASKGVDIRRPNDKTAATESNCLIMVLNMGVNMKTSREAIVSQANDENFSSSIGCAPQQSVILIQP